MSAAGGEQCVNFFTFDVEEWYQTNYEGIDIEWCRRQRSNLESSVDSLLEVCDRHQIRMTCFVLGRLAQEKPNIVRRLHRAGHEIASHGYAHQLISRMTPDAFREDVIASCGILEDITGEKVVGFRAPSYSVTSAILDWYYAVLAERGLSYSSSIYPIKTFLYGIEGFPRHIHYPIVNGTKAKVLEIPAPVVSFCGISVGLYMRLFPAWFITRYMTYQNARGRPIFLYVHPREWDEDQPRLKLSPFVSRIHYFGIRKCLKKLIGY